MIQKSVDIAARGPWKLKTLTKYEEKVAPCFCCKRRYSHEYMLQHMKTRKVISVGMVCARDILGLHQLSRVQFLKAVGLKKG